MGNINKIKKRIYQILIIRVFLFRYKSLVKLTKKNRVQRLSYAIEKLKSYNDFREILNKMNEKKISFYLSRVKDKNILNFSDVSEFLKLRTRLYRILEEDSYNFDFLSLPKYNERQLINLPLKPGIIWIATILKKEGFFILIVQDLVSKLVINYAMKSDDFRSGELISFFDLLFLKTKKPSYLLFNNSKALLNANFNGYFNFSGVRTHINNRKLVDFVYSTLSRFMYRLECLLSFWDTIFVNYFFPQFKLKEDLLNHLLENYNKMVSFTTLEGSSDGNIFVKKNSLSAICKVAEKDSKVAIKWVVFSNLASFIWFTLVFHNKVELEFGKNFPIFYKDSDFFNNIKPYTLNSFYNFKKNYIHKAKKKLKKLNFSSQKISQLYHFLDKFLITEIGGFTYLTDKIINMLSSEQKKLLYLYDNILDIKKTDEKNLTPIHVGSKDLKKNEFEKKTKTKQYYKEKKN